MITLDKIRSLSDPLRNYAFQMDIPNVPGGGDGEMLSLRVASTVVPGQRSEVTEVRLGGQTQRFAGRQTFSGTITLEIIESINADIYRTLQAWYDLQWNMEDATQELSSTYKTDVYLQLLDNTNSPVLTRRLEGCFIAEISDISVSADSSDPLRVSLQLSYDRVHTE